MLTKILSRTKTGSLPIGWTQVSGYPEREVTRLAYALAQSRPDAAIIHLAGGQAGNGVYAVEASSHIAFDLLAEWLKVKAFSLVVIEPFDAVLPLADLSAAHRAHWIGCNVRQLRPLIRDAGATIVTLCHSPKSGGHVFQAEIGLTLGVRPNCDGVLVMCGGRSVRVGVEPVVYHRHDYLKEI